MTRVDPPEAGDERSTLIGFIDYHRATLLMKCDGLSGAQLAQQSAPPSTLSLLGLLRHLAEVERGWFQNRLGAQSLPSLYCEDSWTGDLDLPPGDRQVQADEAFATYRAEIARSDELLAGVSDLGQMFRHDRHDLELSVRWLLAHIIEEYARHNGHADLLREAIDGTTGE